MRRIFVISVCACLAATPALAAVTAEQIVEKEVVTRDDSGNETVARIKAETVAPGEEVIYSLRFSNEGGDPAEDVVLVMPVPAEVSYVEGSVGGQSASISFSADGGQTYVARGRLMISEDGEERPAKSNEITHIKWSLTEALPTQEPREVSYRAVLK